MYEKAFELEIITPVRVVYKDQATSLSAPGVQGNFQILYDHAPFLSALDIGEIKVKDKNGSDSRYATSGGLVEVNDNRVVVLADTVERSSDIDVERARAAKDRAEEQLRSRHDQIEEERLRAALARAVNRLRLSQRS